MVQIVATDQLLRDLQSADGVVEFVDPDGNRLGTLLRPPSADDIRIAKERLAGDGKRHTTEEVVAHLKTLEDA